MPEKNRNATRLAVAVCGFVLAGAVMASAGAWFVLEERLARIRETAITEALSTRAQGVQLDIARTLETDWRNMRKIAARVSEFDSAALRNELDILAGDNERVSWVGVASVDGTVQRASGGLLEGEDVSERPWFQRGLEGNFAGNVHKAVLLADLLPATDGEARRFLDLATPITAADGRVTGVLGMHLDQGWFMRRLAENASHMRLDAVIVDREGDIVLASEPTLALPTNTASMRAAMAGSAHSGLETWPDGRNYLTTVIPDIDYGDMPSFGWSMIAHIDSGVLAMQNRAGSVTLFSFLFGFGLLLAAMTFLFLQVYIRPLGQLSRSAAAILAGEDVYPYESSSSREASTLSSAIARLQFLADHRKPRS